VLASPFEFGSGCLLCVWLPSPFPPLCFLLFSLGSACLFFLFSVSFSLSFSPVLLPLFLFRLLPLLFVRLLCFFLKKPEATLHPLLFFFFFFSSLLSSALFPFQSLVFLPFSPPPAGSPSLVFITRECHAVAWILMQ
jgi:hypothetical protein